MPSSVDTIFVHLWRSEGMIESTCAVCLPAICREPTLQLVWDYEDDHACPGLPPPARIPLELGPA